MHATDWQPARFPVSVKGVAVQDGRVLLLRNERDEWELPGGKIAVGEQPTECLVREIDEETSWKVEVASLLSSWLYHIRDGVDVFVVAYGCRVLTGHAPRVSHEHKDIGLFTPAVVPDLVMPRPYKDTIATWCTMLGLE